MLATVQRFWTPGRFGERARLAAQPDRRRLALLHQGRLEENIVSHPTTACRGVLRVVAVETLDAGGGEASHSTPPCLGLSLHLWRERQGHFLPIAQRQRLPVTDLFKEGPDGPHIELERRQRLPPQPTAPERLKLKGREEPWNAQRLAAQLVKSERVPRKANIGIGQEDFFQEVIRPIPEVLPVALHREKRGGIEAQRRETVCRTP